MTCLHFFTPNTSLSTRALYESRLHTGVSASAADFLIATAGLTAIPRWVIATEREYTLRPTSLVLTFADLEIEIVMRTQTSSISELVKATDLVATLVQVHIDPRTEPPILGLPLDETHAEKREGKRLILTFHLPALELVREVVPQAFDDVLVLLLLEIGGISFQTV